jgi:hypothetical protein
MWPLPPCWVPADAGEPRNTSSNSRFTVAVQGEEGVTPAHESSARAEGVEGIASHQRLPEVVMLLRACYAAQGRGPAQTRPDALRPRRAGAYLARRMRVNGGGSAYPHALCSRVRLMLTPSSHILPYADPS